jgi:hypothetical protein
MVFSEDGHEELITKVGKFCRLASRKGSGVRGDLTFLN